MGRWRGGEVSYYSTNKKKQSQSQRPSLHQLGNAQSNPGDFCGAGERSFDPKNSQLWWLHTLLIFFSSTGARKTDLHVWLTHPWLMETDAGDQNRPGQAALNKCLSQQSHLWLCSHSRSSRKVDEEWCWCCLCIWAATHSICSSYLAEPYIQISVCGNAEITG